MCACVMQLSAYQYRAVCVPASRLFDWNHKDIGADTHTDAPISQH